MSGVQTLTVTDDDDDIRLDRWFKKYFPSLRHGRLEKLLRTGQIRLNGGRAKAGTRVHAGQAVRVPPMDADASSARAAKKPQREISTSDVEALQAAILYRDDDVLAINKEPGLAVQGGSGVTRHLDAMLDVLKFDAKERPRLVHRLDRDTSGVMLLARTAKAARFMTASFRAGSTDKIYWAIVCGVPRPQQGEISGYLSKERIGGEERVAVTAQGQSAITGYRTISTAAQRAAWLELRPQTGRTHQLRVHCASIGTPILSDGKYGGAAAFLEAEAIAKRLHLHAHALIFPHPAGGTRTVKAPLPQHMSATWNFLGFDENDPETQWDEDVLLSR